VVQANGSTSLHVAAYYGHLGTCKILVLNGASLHLKNHNGKTAYDDAVDGSLFVSDEDKVSKFDPIKELIQKVATKQPHLAKLNSAQSANSATTNSAKGWSWLYH